MVPHRYMSIKRPPSSVPELSLPVIVVVYDQFVYNRQQPAAILAACSFFCSRVSGSEHNYRGQLRFSPVLLADVEIHYDSLHTTVRMQLCTPISLITGGVQMAMVKWRNLKCNKRRRD
jgi:hypothetical protein